MATLETVPVSEADAGSGFRSGVPALDSYFTRHAVENDRRGIGKTFVLKSEEGAKEPPLVLGYYTLSMADVEAPALPKKLARGLPAYPIPVALIGRLATDARVRGQGHGARLLRDALTRVVLVSQQIACFGAVVDAKDAHAVGFYGRYGFLALGADAYPRRMFISMKTVIKSMGEA